MLNYIRMDLFKLFKSKYFYICMVIFVVVTGLEMFKIKDTEEAFLNGNYYAQQIKGTGTFYTSGLGTGWESIVGLHEMNLQNLINVIYGSNWVLFIFFNILVIFVCNDFSWGYIKNTIEIPQHRWYANISKLVSAVVVMAALNVILILEILFHIKFYFKTAVVGSLGNLPRYLFVQLILYLGIAALVTLLCNIMKSKAFSITFGVCYSSQLLGGIVIFFVGKLTKISMTTVSKGIISFTQSNLMADMSKGQFMNALLLGAVAIFFYITLANIVICKRDV